MVPNKSKNEFVFLMSVSNWVLSDTSHEHRVMLLLYAAAAHCSAGQQVQLAQGWLATGHWPGNVSAFSAACCSFGFSSIQQLLLPSEWKCLCLCLTVDFGGADVTAPFSAKLLFLGIDTKKNKYNLEVRDFHRRE